MRHVRKSRSERLHRPRRARPTVPRRPTGAHSGQRTRGSRSRITRHNSHRMYLAPKLKGMDR
eukprot:6288945-Prymnesium_polylepis.1